MKKGFHSEQLGLRGTEIALYDYASYAREYFGVDPIIYSNRNGAMQSLEKFQAQFAVMLYDHFDEAIRHAHQQNLWGLYYIKGGWADNKLVPGIRNMVHAVFQVHQPHGERHAYVSRWLATKMGGEGYPYVPHMVDILKYDHQENFRSAMNIPNDALVLGYHGGPDSFNIPFAKEAVYEAVQQRSDIYFIFMNINKFCTHERVLFFEGTTDMFDKVAFINTADVMIHARNGGESFGLSVAEFSRKNKPIITTSYTTEALNDMAHLDVLGDTCFRYESKVELMNILLHLSKPDITAKQWDMYQKYDPQSVMTQFNSVFLS